MDQEEWKGPLQRKEDKVSYSVFTEGLHHSVIWNKPIHDLFYTATPLNNCENEYTAIDNINS